MFHRCYACPARDAFRRDCMPTELARSAGRMRQSPPAWKERFARGLFPGPGLCVGGPPFSPSWGMQVHGALQLPILLEG
eukprot:931027-Pyramimonas_sp.AAC.1